ncbi:TetR/AcrR family transcriptional regulator [Streptomyces sp. LZ34]
MHSPRKPPAPTAPDPDRLGLAPYADDPYAEEPGFTREPLSDRVEVAVIGGQRLRQSAHRRTPAPGSFRTRLTELRWDEAESEWGTDPLTALAEGLAHPVDVAVDDREDCYVSGDQLGAVLRVDDGETVTATTAPATDHSSMSSSDDTDLLVTCSTMKPETVPEQLGPGGRDASVQRAPRAGRRVASAGRKRLDDDRREELLGQLQAIVLEEGFARLTVDTLAARLQCSKSTLYAISSSRHHLVATALKRFFRDAAEQVETEVATVADPAQQIATYLASVGTQMRRMSAACYDDMLDDDATREIYTVNSLAATRRVREMIHAGVEAGDFRSVHAEFVSQAVGLLIDGIHSRELLGSTGLSSGDAFIELSNLVLAALSKTPR